ncbi:MAG: DUF2304 domain-containing protein [Micrococcales bacterium]|nr:DUF2304 domain-containing protein [Micrococcales bacterium]
MWIKILIIVVLFAVVAVMLRAQGSRNLALRRISIVVFTVAAAASAIFPDVWSTMADALGVGRGTDLLLYLFIMVTLAFIAATYLHFRSVEAQITQLARRIALDEAGFPAQPGPTSDQASTGDRAETARADDLGSGQPTG